MKITTENGTRYDNLEKVESLLKDGHTFIIEDIPIRMTSNYVKKVLKKNDISYYTAYFSVMAKRLLLSLLTFMSIFLFFILFFVALHKVTHGNDKFLYLLRDTPTREDAKPLYFKNIFSRNVYSIEEEFSRWYYVEGSRLTEKGALSIIADPDDICFVSDDTIYVISSEIFMVLSLSLSLLFSSLLSFIILKKYIFVKVEYIITKNIFYKSIEFVYKEYV